MYEPYLNREKQYLKMNADLDNRFKEIDQMKNDSPDIVAPRLNVFGNGSKVINQSAKLSFHASKQKRNEIKCAPTPKVSGDVLNQNALGETASSVRTIDRFVDKPQKLKTTTITSHSHQENDCNSKNKSSDHIDTVPSVVISRIQDRITGTTTVSPANEATVKKNISSDGLIK